jgi:hypothetical protein
MNTKKKTKPKTNWQKTEYDAGVKIQQVGPSGFRFVFPGSNGHINSVVANRKGVLPKPVRTISIRYRISAISGNPTFKFVDHSGGGGLPPNFRPRIATSFLENRYWPSGVNCAMLALTGAEQVYTVRCAPSVWQDVYGGSNPKGFTSTLKQNGLWVISFGGGNNFEHGVFCTGGSAKFELLEFKIA